MDTGSAMLGDCPLCGEDDIVLENFWGLSARPLSVTDQKLACESCGARWEDEGGWLRLQRYYECVDADDPDAVGAVLTQQQWKRASGDAPLEDAVRDLGERSLLFGSYLGGGAVLFGVGALLATLLGFLLVTIPIGIGLMIAGAVSVLYGLVQTVIS